ncbi:spore germination protein [Bacillus rugosus]|uniref:Spore germination protein n=1 Tax=Bacillus rugosus TaxID=2715209 RepID=A0ACD4A0G2_9BACI|nr:spore germination protein [Bacillus rugosus]UPV79739.1 spore germination protein [Bacillus rugosus]
MDKYPNIHSISENGFSNTGGAFSISPLTVSKSESGDSGSNTGIVFRYNLFNQTSSTNSQHVINTLQELFQNLFDP